MNTDTAADATAATGNGEGLTLVTPPARPGGVRSKQDLLLERLLAFYGGPGRVRELTGLLPRHKDSPSPPDSGRGRVSLRILDWLVTNYAKKHNIVYVVPGGDGEPCAFNMYLEYKSQLKAFGKRFFDPFCRRETLEFRDATTGRSFHTTLGQLNFFRWALLNGVVDYGARHAAAIEEDMLQSIRHRGAAGRPRRRQELSRAAIKGCTKTQVRVTVRFT